MKNKILQLLAEPRKLEELYRDNKTAFKSAFNALYPEITHHSIATIWNERLNFEQENIHFGSANEIWLVLLASLAAGFLAKFPQLLGLNPEFYYPQNIGFIVFPFLSAYFAWKNQISTRKIVYLFFIFIATALYINLLPHNKQSDTLILACIHLPIFLWSIFGYSFTSGSLSNTQKRLDFLRFNGDLLIMTTIILISGGIMTAFTIGMFELIEIHIEKFYMNNIVLFGLAAAPIIGTFLVQSNPQLVNKVSPIIARVFTPLVLITLIIYVFAVIFAGKDPFNDRDFLILFNLLLIAVMALILFSLSESSKNVAGKWGTALLFSLALVTILINGIALSAIVFRISEWGLTPNRLAVLGGNLLILSNLLLVSYHLYNTLRNPNALEKAEKSIALFLPIYSAWTLFVTLVFPVLFGFE